MPEKLARSVVVTPCCRHHSLTERPLLRHSWICAAHSCSSARCFNSALVILTSHNTTVAKPFATFRYYCLMCVYARLGLTVTFVLPCPAFLLCYSFFSQMEPIGTSGEKSIPKRAYLYFGAEQKLYGSQSYFGCLANTCFAFSYTGFKHLQATPKIQSVYLLWLKITCDTKA